MNVYTHPTLSGIHGNSAFVLDDIQYPRSWWRTVDEDEIADMGFVPYEPPAPEPELPQVPHSITRYQIITGLAIVEWITKEEALAAITTGATPAVLNDLFTQLPSDEEFMIRMKWAGFLNAYRNDPLVLMLAQLVEKSEQEIDEFFIMCAGIE